MKFLAVCACLILFPVVLFPRINVYSQQPTARARQLYAEDQIIVKLKAGTAPDSDATAREILRAPGVSTEALKTRHRTGTELVHLNGNLSVEEAVLRAKEDPRVEYAEPDYFVYAT